MRFVPLVLWLGAVTAGITYFLWTGSEAPVPAAAPAITPATAPATTSASSSKPERNSASRIRESPSATATDLGLPIYGLRAADIQDTFAQTREGVRPHEATDILAPRGT